MQGRQGISWIRWKEKEGQEKVRTSYGSVFTSFTPDVACGVGICPSGDPLQRENLQCLGKNKGPHHWKTGFQQQTRLVYQQT
eukprot:s1743_g1.t1